MNAETDSTLFVDHRGGLRRRPPHTPAVPRSGIHGLLCFGGRLLLVRPPGADWLELPGGGVENGEDLAAALSRELHEEAGVRLPPRALEPARRITLQSRYYAATRDAFWEYRQCFWLIELAREPVGGPPLEAGHRREWLALAALHQNAIHHVHRVGIDRLLGLHG